MFIKIGFDKEECDNVCKRLWQVIFVATVKKKNEEYFFLFF